MTFIEEKRNIQQDKDIEQRIRLDEWQEVAYCLGHTIGEAYTSTLSCLDKAISETASDKKQELLEITRQKLLYASSLGFLMNHIKSVEESPSEKRWGFYTLTQEEELLFEKKSQSLFYFSKDYLRKRLDEIVAYANDYPRSSIEKVFKTWYEKEGYTSIFTNFESKKPFCLFQLGLDNPPPVSLEGVPGCALNSLLTEIVLHFIRNNNYENIGFGLMSRFIPEKQKLQLIIVGHRDKDIITDDLSTIRASKISQRNKTGLSLSAVLVRSLGWKLILQSTGEPNINWFPKDAKNKLLVDFSRPYQAIGFEAPADIS